MTLVADLNPNVSIPFSRMRQLFEDTSLQAGVLGINNYKVAQRGAGANMSVDVPAGQAWVEVTTGTRNGLVHIVNDATANVTVTASNGSNPRIDQIILRYNDSVVPTGSGDIPTLAVLTGTATSGATLANRTGAAALSADAIRLADILVPAASTSVTTANIVDRRRWACGANFRMTGTSQTVAGSGFPTPAALSFESGPTSVWFNFECRAINSGSTGTLRLFLTLDGTTVANSYNTIVSGYNQTITIRTPVLLAAGRHSMTWDGVRIIGAEVFDLSAMLYGVEESTIPTPTTTQ